MISQLGGSYDSICKSTQAAGLPDLLLLFLFIGVWVSLPGSALWQPRLPPAWDKSCQEQPWSM